MPDMINSPPHYQSDGGIECIDAIRVQLTHDEFRGFLKGNVIKYMWREGKKDKDSAAKAQWYLERLNKLAVSQPDAQQAQPKVKRKRKPRLRIARAEMSEDRRALLDRMKELGINTRGKWQRSDAQLAEEIEAHLRQPQTTEA